jgi:hypothetical protein
MEQPARIEGVRDQPELQPALAQRLEQGMRVRREQARRLPRLVLGLEEAPELVVVDFDPEVAEQPPHELRVLDLLDHACRPEERLVLLAKVLGQLGPMVQSDRGKTGSVTCTDQLGRVRKLHQRVAPVEEHGPQHASLG